MPSRRQTHAAGILGTGSYLPAEVVPNRAIAARIGVDDGWSERTTGVRTRRYAAADEATSDLAVAAGRANLVQAGVAPEQLGLVLVATSTPDHPQPSTANLVQHGLGAADAAAFDLNAVCNGFVYTLVTAVQLLSGGPLTISPYAW